MNPQPGFAPQVTMMGQGPRRILALHCSLAFGGAWSGLAKHLGDDLTFVAPDMPSHGRSVDWDAVSDFADTTYGAAVDSLDPKPMDVVGHSFGAVLALRLAANHPHRVRSLTLIEPVFFAVALQDVPEVLTEHDANSADFVNAATLGNRSETARLFNRIWGDGSNWSNLSEKSRAAMIRAIPMIPATADFLYDDSASLLLPNVLQSATMPTLLIRGSRSVPVIKVIADGLVSRMPNAEQVVVEDAGHMVPISHPALVADAMAKLLARS